MSPVRKIQFACGVIFFIAIVNLGVGLAALFFHVEILLKQGMGIWNIIYGVGFFILGFLAVKRSSIALAIAAAVFLIDSILSFSIATQKIATPPAGVLIARIVFLITLIQGFFAIRALKNAPGTSPDK
jgi:hypothetical protein